MKKNCFPWPEALSAVRVLTVAGLLGLVVTTGLEATITLSTNGGTEPIDIPGHTLNYSSGPIVQYGLNGVDGRQATRTYGASIGNGVVNLSMTADADRDAGGSNVTANATMSFNFTDTLFISADGPISITFTPSVSINNAGDGLSGWVSHVRFGLNSTETGISRSTEDYRGHNFNAFTATAQTVEFDPTTVGGTAEFTLSYLSFFDENAWAQTNSPATSTSMSLGLQYYMRITDITGGTIVTSASGTDYLAAVPEPATAALALAFLSLAVVARNAPRCGCRGFHESEKRSS